MSASKHRDQPETYLGDGLYVSFDGYYIALRAPREGGDHVVYLEAPVWRALKAYVGQLTKHGGADDGA